MDEFKHSAYVRNLEHNTALSEADYELPHLTDANESTAVILNGIRGLEYLVLPGTFWEQWSGYVYDCEPLDESEECAQESLDALLLALLYRDEYDKNYSYSVYSYSVNEENIDNRRYLKCVVDLQTFAEYIRLGAKVVAIENL